MTPEETIISIDFETFSLADLPKTGAYVYSEDPSTEVLCLGYSINNQEPKIWTPEDTALPLDLFKAMEGPYKLYAWNAFFEICIWKNVCEVKYGFPSLELKNVIDSMAIACSYSLPAKLKDCADVLDTFCKKDLKGTLLINKFSMVNGKTKKRTTRYDDPEAFQELCDYCLQDVRTEMSVLDKLPAKQLIPSEQEVWYLNLLSNLYGVHLDKELVLSVLNHIDKIEEELEKRCIELTGVRSTQRDKIVEWVNSKGGYLKGFTKGDITAAIKQDLPEDVREVLLIRQETGRTSTAKYEAMKNCMSQDGRVRGVSFYHGASTGRFAGRLVQLQNLPKGELSEDQDPIKIAEEIRSMTLEEIKKAHPLPMLVFSSIIRGAIIPSLEHELFVADYSSIEARVLAWMAGQEDLVESFSKGEDVYKFMASQIFKKPPEEINDIERFLGKGVILGCFGPDTKVLTDSGWKQIISIQLTDKLWDGEEWVTHKGIVCQGKKEVINAWGLDATKDHEILTEHGWREWQEVTTNHFLFQSAIKKANSQSLDGNNIQLQKENLKDGILLYSVYVDGKEKLIGIILKEGKLLDAIAVLKKLQLIQERNIGDMRIFFLIWNIDKDFLTELRPVLEDAIQKHLSITPPMEDEVLKFLKIGEKTEENFLNILLPLKDGIIQNWRLIESTTIEDMNQVILDLLQEVKTPIIDEQLQNSKKKMMTYDIAYAGPRNKYMVATNAGAIIVHNCGYGMGPDKFRKTCLFQKPDLELSEQMSKEVIALYREQNPFIRNMWYTIENNARSAIKNKGAVYTAHKCKFMCNGDFLFIKLPSSRVLSYYKPYLMPETTPWGSETLRIYFYGMNSITKQWEATQTYGGKLVENIVQGTARDFMVHGMKETINQGFKLLTTVHDEIISEAPKESNRKIQEFVESMTSTPSWGLGCPIDAKGWKGERYKK